MLLVLVLFGMVPPNPGVVASAFREPSAETEAVWKPNVRWAEAYARKRSGTVRFAVVNERGRVWGHRGRQAVPMASVFKVMLMTAYLRHPTVRHRDLRQADRDLLAPMIRWSDNTTATRILRFLGPGPLHRLADRAGMERFSLTMSPWGLSQTSARDQAPFMHRLERFIPDRHERYARRLLRTIVPSQRWGIAEVVPRGWTIHFKGGWGSGTGWVTHQVAFLERDDRRIAVAIMVRNSPSHAYGTRTIRGVASRLLRPLE